MDIRKGFYDLCLPYDKDEANLLAILGEMYEFGYRTVAIEQVFDHSKCQKKSNELFPGPVDISSLQQKFKGKIKILQRLSIIYANGAVSHDMNISLNLRKYHVIAAQPMSEGALQHACSTFNGDIINVVSEDAKISLISHKYYQMAARRGMFFELRYAPAIRDSNQRKDFISVGYNLVSNRKAKNVVITSGVLNAFQVRGPYDVANLYLPYEHRGLIFGLSEEQAKSAISLACRTILLKAEGRRYGKTVIFAKNVKGTKFLNESEDDDDNDDMDVDSESDDDMDGHPPKKQKML